MVFTVTMYHVNVLCGDDSSCVRARVTTATVLFVCRYRGVEGVPSVLDDVATHLCDLLQERRACDTDVGGGPAPDRSERQHAAV